MTDVPSPATAAKHRLQPRDDVAAMEGYHSPQVSVRVRLNTNESPYPPPARWQQELAAEVARIDFHRYPDRAAWDLRVAIGELHGVGPEWVFAANGSNEVIQTVCLAYGGHGRTAAVFEPTYAMHRHIARTTGSRIIDGVRQSDFSVAPAEVSRVAGEGAHLVFLCSPNNPTGGLASPELVRHALDVSPGLVFVDEAYGQFAPWSAQSLLTGESPLVISRTYSKTWSMAAVRLGYLLAPPWLVAELDKVVLPYHLDALKQAAGVLALRYVDDMNARVEQLVAERERVSGELREMRVDSWPSSANFILFRPVHGEADEVWAAMVDRSVLVRNCSSWPGLRGCLRVTIGTSGENDAFLSALRASLHSMPTSTRIATRPDRVPS